MARSAGRKGEEGVNLYKCNQKGCDQPGLYRYTWPGKDESYICELHVGKLRGVAEAIGLHVQVRSILDEEPSG